MSNFFRGLSIQLTFVFLVTFSLFAEKVEIANGDLTLNAEHLIADGKNKEDATFLILHGTLAHNQMEVISQLSELLLENEKNVLLINLSFAINARKSEFYDCAVPHTHSHFDAVEEIQMWVNWLTSKQKVSEVYVVGHSRGGNQIALFMERASEAVKKAILLAPMTWNYENSKKSFDAKYPNGLSSLLKKANEFSNSDRIDEQMKSIPFLYCDDATASARALLSYYQDDYRRNTPELIAQSDKPFLVFAGSADRVVPDLPEMMEKFSLKKENIEFHMIDTADHFFRDLNMDEVVEIIIDSL